MQFGGENPAAAVQQSWGATFQPGSCSSLTNSNFFQLKQQVLQVQRLQCLVHNPALSAHKQDFFKKLYIYLHTHTHTCTQ